MQELLCLDAGNLAGSNASSQTPDHTKRFVSEEAVSNYPFYGNEDAAPTLQCSLPAPSLSPPITQSGSALKLPQLQHEVNHCS